MDDFDSENITRYEQRRQAKNEEKLAREKSRSHRRLFRLSLWFGVLALLILTVWQVDRLVANKSIGPSDSKITATSTDILVAKETEWTKGSLEAPLILIEYSDFQCPACAQYNALLKKLKVDYGKKLTVIFRHYPWYFHPQAMNAALAAEAAGKQGKFWEMHDLLFAKQDEWSQKTDTGIFTNYASELGLGIFPFEEAMADKNLKSKIESQLSGGKSLGIDYTPAFALNGKIIENPKSYDEFRKVFEQTLAGK